MTLDRYVQLKEVHAPLMTMTHQLKLSAAYSVDAKVC